MARVLAAVVLVPAVLLAVIVVSGPGSWSGIGLVVGIVVVASAPLARRAAVARATVLTGLVVVLGTLGLRCGVGARGAHVTMHAGADSSSRVVNRLVDERDLAVTAARTMRWVHLLGDPDEQELPEVMSRAYARMRAEEGDTPSPVAATYLGLEGPGASDTIEIGDVEPGASVLVFLHGYAGSFTLPCWVVSRAAARAGMATVCPATRWVGDWWSAPGERVLRGVLRDLRARGARRVFLAGLSNGAIGASLLAPRLRGEIAGLVLISGASPTAAAPGVPALVLHGRRDVQLPAGLVRRYAARADARYVEVDAGHFALLVREGALVDAMGEWLAAQGPERGGLAGR